MKNRFELSEDLTQRAKKIRLIAFDVDGVLTDGSLFFGDDGQEYKAFNSKDGHGFKMLHNNGIKTAIITGRTSQVVVHRTKNLGIDIVYQGQQDKSEALDQILKETNVSIDEVAYAGDDVIDLPVLCRVGLAIATSDAHPLVVSHCHWTTPSPGGRGAGRDICEMLLQAQGLLQKEWDKYIPR